MLSKEEANTYLRTKRSMRQGIVCECCIYECNIHELEQYCGNKRRRRSLTDIVAGVPVPPAHHFTKDEVENLYEKIDRESELSSSPVVLTSDDVRKIEMIEENKRENIEKEEVNKKDGHKDYNKHIDTQSGSSESQEAPHPDKKLSQSRSRTVNSASLVANSLGLWHRDR